MQYRFLLAGILLLAINSLCAQTPSEPTYAFDSYIYTTSNANVDHLTALLTGDAGSSFKVYDAATGGSEITSGTDLTDDTTVYAVQVVGGLESATRLAIPVNEICSPTQDMAAGDTVADLAATPGTGLTASWYTAATGGTALATTTSLSSQTYYVEQGRDAGIVSTLAGSSQGFADGQDTSAQFDRPTGVAIDASGNIIVADYYNHRIRKIDAQGNVTTIAGSSQGFDDGQGISARFNYPQGVAVDASGNIIVADRNNHRIRKIDA